jgi:hypothetical protein
MNIFYIKNLEAEFGGGGAPISLEATFASWKQNSFFEAKFDQ